MDKKNDVCPQCRRPWHLRPGWGCRLLAHATATHHPRKHGETLEPPAVGWGILTPDKELTVETLTLVEALCALPQGQRDALITRAAPRYLTNILSVDVLDGSEPTESDMVNATATLSALLMDMLGTP